MTRTDLAGWIVGAFAGSTLAAGFGVAVGSHDQIARGTTRRPPPRYAELQPPSPPPSSSTAGVGR